MMTYHVQFLLLVLAGWVNRVLAYERQCRTHGGPFFGRGFASTLNAGECFTSVVRVTEARGTAATGASNHAVKSSVGRRGVGIKKVLKVAWIIEITSARTRARLKQRVMDQGSEVSEVSVSVSLRVSGIVVEGVSDRETEFEFPARCRVCGRRSRYYVTNLPRPSKNEIERLG